MPTILRSQSITIWMSSRRKSWNGDRNLCVQERNGLYRGRGATDDKGPALSALFGARFAIDQGVPINIRLLWELEEEIGSPISPPD